MIARHPHVLCPDHSLMLIVDMQERLIDGIYDRDRTLVSIRQLIQAATIMHVPIVATTQNADKLGGLEPSLEALLPTLHQPYDKIAFSCLCNPTIAAELQRSGRRQILLCGLEAHICVCQTALDLTQHGYQVHAVEDGISARTEANWKLGLDKMRLSGVIPCSVETAMYEWLGEAGTSQFREILKLVKKPTDEGLQSITVST